MGDSLFDFILDFVTQKRTHLESSLRGVNGFTGRGDITFAVWPNGKRKLDVALRGVAGRVAEVYANDTLAVTIDLDDGRAGRTFYTRRGDAVPYLTQDMRIDVRQNGQVILEGAFTIV